MAASRERPIMGARAATRLAVAVWSLTLTILGLDLLLWAVDGFRPPPGSEALPRAATTALIAIYLLTFATLATMGALIATRHPHNPIGWLCAACGGMMAAQMGASTYATSRAVAIAWVGTLLNVWLALIIPLVLLFPDGHLPSRRWRPVLWLAPSSAALAGTALAFRPGPLGTAPGLINPLGLPGAAAVLGLALDAATVLLLVGAVLSAAALVLRLRRARGVERQQLTWTVFAAALWAAALVGSFVSPRDWVLVTQLLYFAVLDGFLVTVGLAVLKYRLYEVDLIVNRALVYGTLAVLITLAYVAVVVGIGALVGTRGEPSLALSLVATAGVAVAFQPLRERLQRVANRVVYGQRASPYVVLADFSRRMAGALSVDEVLPRMAEAAARGVGAARCRVRVYVPGGADQAVAWPAEAREAAFDRSILVLHRGTPVGEIAVAKPAGEPLTAAEAGLLADLAEQAGLALSNVRLAVELAARLEQLADQARELRASRQRIVTAQDAERRRLERDLHDGAQQQLVAIAVTARLARQVAGTTPMPTPAAALLDDISTQAAEALDMLRDLARGIFPPLLAERGLVAALRAQLARGSASIQLEAAPSLVGARFAPPVEAAVYFCCLEALQNATKHAAGAPVSVRLAEEDGSLAFSVRDEGPGFDLGSVAHGTGLHSMADRVAALDGTFSVESTPGGPTLVAGRVPHRLGAASGQDEPVVDAQTSRNRSEPKSDFGT
jgi:signal transduction histidine kinase